MVGPMPNQPLLKLPAAASYLGITERHLRLLLERRELRFYKVGRLNMFDPDDLDAYIASSRVEAVQ